MFRPRNSAEIGYTVQVTLMNGQLRFEESGKLIPDHQTTEQDISRAESDVRKALQRVYTLVMGKVAAHAIHQATTKGFREGAGLKEELEAVGIAVEDKWVVTVAEAAELLAVSKSTIYELVRTGQIPSLTIGKSKRIPVRELRDWIATHTKAPR